MKASFAYISCQLPLVALLAFAPRVHGAESAMELTAFAFKSCNDVVKKTAGAENFDHQRLTIREDYTVDLFIAKVSQSSKPPRLSFGLRTARALRRKIRELPRSAL